MWRGERPSAIVHATFERESAMRKLLLTVLLLSHAAMAEPVLVPLPDGTVLRADLYRPSAAIRAPAIVALHGCGGPYPSRDRQWRDLLLGQGHVLLFPDSFGSRGLGSQCRVVHRSVTSFKVRRDDAIASARWLAARPETPAGGVVLLGWSDGGSTVLAAGRLAGDLPMGLIRGLIAFYPGCSVALRNTAWQPAAPMLILMGRADDWDPAPPCEAVASRFTPDRLTLIAYPGAYHDFDAPGGIGVMHDIPTSQNPDRTVHVGTDPGAREDALRRVPAFLDALAPASPTP